MAVVTLAKTAARPLTNPGRYAGINVGMSLKEQQQTTPAAAAAAAMVEMETRCTRSCILPLLLAAMLVMNTQAQQQQQQQQQHQQQQQPQRGAGLSVNFYQEACPDVEKIIQQVVIQKFKEAPVAAAGTLRIFFHDCMVEGCDASVLIASTPGNKAEKDSDINLSLPGDGFDTVMRAKRAVENKCPGVVSCADVLAIATRDMVSMIGGPFWNVKKGRRDGLVSQASRTGNNLPRTTNTLTQLMGLFFSKGFYREEMVALAGAHTAGFAHCKEFSERIYNWNSTSRSDPSMSPSYAANLRLACPPKVDPTVVANLDVTTSRRFDNVYYQNLQKRLGLLSTDQDLYTDLRTRPYVDKFAASQAAFFAAFASAMDKLGSTGVKTGNQGEIRKNCAAFNHR